MSSPPWWTWAITARSGHAQPCRRPVYAVPGLRPAGTISVPIRYQPCHSGGAGRSVSRSANGMSGWTVIRSAAGATRTARCCSTRPRRRRASVSPRAYGEVVSCSRYPRRVGSVPSRWARSRSGRNVGVLTGGPPLAELVVRVSVHRRGAGRVGGGRVGGGRVGGGRLGGQAGPSGAKPAGRVGVHRLVEPGPPHPQLPNIDQVGRPAGQGRPAAGGGFLEALVHRGDPGEHPLVRVWAATVQEHPGGANDRPGGERDVEDHGRLVRHRGPGLVPGRLRARWPCGMAAVPLGSAAVSRPAAATAATAG